MIGYTYEVSSPDVMNVAKRFILRLGQFNQMSYRLFTLA
jgi:hypothetical protein